MNYMHKDLAAGKWYKMDLCEQLPNIGSEISRANRALKLNKEENKVNAVYRALELIDLTIDDITSNIDKYKNRRKSTLKEITRLRECVCDFYLGDNIYDSSAISFIDYFDHFAIENIITKNKMMIK